MPDRQESVQLPDELLLYIAKYFDGDEDGLSLAISEAVEGFSSLYSDERERVGWIISHKCYFLTSYSWSCYFTKYITPESMASFNANNCYWLPGGQICCYILKMINLQNLAIKGTKISLPQLARALATCAKITSLDFSYHHLKGLELENEKQLKTPAVIKSFKKLISLKVSTSVKDVRDYLNDPWLFITKILSWCKDCKDLTIQITFAGNSCSYAPAKLSKKYKNDLRVWKKDLLDLKWMLSLRSLAIIKFGPFNNGIEGYPNMVRSVLLDDLLNRMFPDEETPLRLSMECLWIHDFYFSPGLDRVLSITPNLKAYRVVEPLSVNSFEYGLFNDHLGELGNFRFAPLVHLTNLKSAYGKFLSQQDPQDMISFIETHPNLEHLTFDGEYFPNIGNFRLLKLKKLYCSCIMNKDTMDELARAFPNIEILTLQTYSENMETRSDRDCLAAIRFRHVSSLVLESFNLHDGALLRPIIAQCPKLERIYLYCYTSSISCFVLNLEIFLEKASKLRDFRFLRHSSTPDVKVSDALLVLTSLKRCASHLERVNLSFICYGTPSDWDYPLADFLVKFALKMKRLTALCLCFYGIDRALLTEANRRIVEEVIPLRPSLWVHLDNVPLDPVDQSVPGYKQPLEIQRDPRELRH